MRGSAGRRLQGRSPLRARRPTEALRATEPSQPATSHLGQQALTVVIHHGLAEYLCPARRHGAWVVYPRTRPWKQVAKEVHRAVTCRATLDFEWELQLEQWEPDPDAQTEVQSPLSSPESPGY